MTRRLLTLEEAKDYCGGVSPKTFVKPVRTPNGMRYDRNAIDARLDEIAGLTPRSAANDADAALLEWEHGAGHGPA